MSVADLARSVAEQNAFEAKKDAVRQVQSGDWRLTLTVKAGDLPTSVMTAAPGARYVVALVPIDDDEMPISGGEAERVQPVGNTDPPGESGGSPARRRWSEMSRAQRAGMLCGTGRFHEWLEKTDDLRWASFLLACDMNPDEAAASFVRHYCRDRRRNFDNNEDAAARWDALEARFMQATGRMAVDR